MEFTRHPLSITMTFRPSNCASIAQARPVGPAPITSTSELRSGRECARARGRVSGISSMAKKHAPESANSDVTKCFAGHGGNADFTMRHAQPFRSQTRPTQARGKAFLAPNDSCHPNLEPEPVKEDGRPCRWPASIARSGGTPTLHDRLVCPVRGLTTPRRYNFRLLFEGPP